MLAKKNRLTKKQFDVVFKEGQNVHSDFLFAKVLETKEDKSRFAVTVSKKIIKKAVTRNLLRRQGYAVIQENWDNIKTGFDCVIFFKKGGGELEYQELKKEFESILKKAKILN